jgi:hypothetical protein
MKEKILLLIIIIGIGVFWLLDPAVFVKAEQNLREIVYSSPCDVPIGYHIGSVDQQFNLSTDALTIYIDDAVDIWDRASGKKLFVYDKNSKLTINMVYDIRQSLDNQINQIEKNVNNKRNNLDSQSAEYDTLVAAYNQKMADFTTQVNYWNGKGGAPQDVYDKLNQEKSDLQSEANRINALAGSLNKNAANYNLNVQDLNQTIKQFNSAIKERPEEGLYNGKTQEIDIYFNVSKNELIHTIAHEFGHAIGMEHVTNPDAIMYAYSTESIAPLRDDEVELDKICAKTTIIEKITQKLVPLVIQMQNNK